MFCVECGNTLSDKARFCKSCGKEVRNRTSQIGDVPGPLPTSTRSRPVPPITHTPEPIRPEPEPDYQKAPGPSLSDLFAYEPTPGSAARPAVVSVNAPAPGRRLITVKSVMILFAVISAVVLLLGMVPIIRGLNLFSGRTAWQLQHSEFLTNFDDFNTVFVRYSRLRDISIGLLNAQRLLNAEYFWQRYRSQYPVIAVKVWDIAVGVRGEFFNTVDGIHAAFYADDLFLIRDDSLLFLDDSIEVLVNRWFSEAREAHYYFFYRPEQFGMHDPDIGESHFLWFMALDGTWTLLWEASENMRKFDPAMQTGFLQYSELRRFEKAFMDMRLHTARHVRYYGLPGSSEMYISHGVPHPFWSLSLRSHTAENYLYLFMREIFADYSVREQVREELLILEDEIRVLINSYVRTVSTIYEQIARYGYFDIWLLYDEQNISSRTANLLQAIYRVKGWNDTADNMYSFYRIDVQ